MNTQQSRLIMNVMSRNEELKSLRKGAILRECGIQKKELYRILKVIRSFDNTKPPSRKP